MIVENVYVTPWADKSDSDILHSLCSYLGSFPPSLASYFIRYFTDENDLVLDTFAGAGTTPAISKELNRNYIGFEIDKSYYNIALKRIEDHGTVDKVAHKSPNALEDALY